MPCEALITLPPVKETSLKARQPRERTCELPSRERIITRAREPGRLYKDSFASLDLLGSLASVRAHLCDECAKKACAAGYEVCP
jgi:hypothetical protein